MTPNANASTVSLSKDLIAKLRSRKHPGQTLGGIIEELLTTLETSPNTTNYLPDPLIKRLEEYRKPNHSIAETVEDLLDAIERLNVGKDNAQ